MQRDLPRWPVLMFGAAFPVLWLLGLGFLLLPLVGAVASLQLVRRRHGVLPPPWFLWFGFLVFATASVVQIDSGPRLMGFALRLSMVLGATALAVYVYSATPRSVPATTVYASFFMLWAFTVLGGWLGILFPEGRLTTPASLVMPGALLSNDLVSGLVTPSFAQVERPWGRDVIARPSAPFQATNGWGCNAALLIPIMVGYIGQLRGWKRVGVIAVTVMGVPPALASLNRGLLIGLTIAALYFAFHGIVMGRLRSSLLILLAGALLGVVFVLSGAWERLQERTSDGGSNATRSLLYRETWERVQESPLLGYGAPRPSYSVEISVGTQGHVWLVMFSYGLVALALFIGYLAAMAWYGRRVTGPATAAHVTSVVGVLLPFFYGFDGPQIAVLLVAGVLAVRDTRVRIWPTLMPQAQPWSGGSASSEPPAEVTR